MPAEPVKRVRIGGGGACAEDWLHPAADLVRHGRLDYICFDSLSESEISSVAYSVTLDKGAVPYDRYLEARMRLILPLAAEHNVKIIGNMGSMDPIAAQRRTAEIAAELGLTGLKVAAVYGDDVLHHPDLKDLVIDRTGKQVGELGAALISAHAYTPVNPIVDALAAGADVVLAGRVGDGAMYLAPLMYEFGWADDDWDAKALGVLVGHQLECAGQLSGGFYADPPYKVMPDLANLAYPIAEVGEDRSVVFSTLDTTGGVLNVATCIEQLLYETTDPANYVHADVVVDFSGVEFVETGVNQVEMRGTVRGRPAPSHLKVALGMVEGYLSTMTVYYGGVGAIHRARLAAEVARRRLVDFVGIDEDLLDIRLLGVDGLFGPGRISEELAEQLWEVGLRVACRTDSLADAEAAGTLGAINQAINGPAGVSCGHGVRDAMVRRVIAFDSVLMPRETVVRQQGWELVEA